MEILANELRLGNLVYYNGTHKEVGTITGLNSAVSKQCYVYLNNRVNNTLDLDMIEPIPLTEDYLFRFGGEKHFDRIIYGRFALNYKSNYKYWYVTDLESNCYMTKVEFVHEWQNFIHAIDGNELILKNS